MLNDDTQIVPPAVELGREYQKEGAVGLSRVLGNAWRIIYPYWFSEDRWPARGLLLAVVSLNLGIVYINVLLNKWNNAFYDALQYRNCARSLRRSTPNLPLI